MINIKISSVFDIKYNKVLNLIKNDSDQVVNTIHFVCVILDYF